MPVPGPTFVRAVRHDDRPHRRPIPHGLLTKRASPTLMIIAYAAKYASGFLRPLSRLPSARPSLSRATRKPTSRIPPIRRSPARSRTRPRPKAADMVHGQAGSFRTWNFHRVSTTFGVADARLPGLRRIPPQIKAAAKTAGFERRRVMMEPLMCFNNAPGQRDPSPISRKEAAEEVGVSLGKRRCGESDTPYPCKRIYSHRRMA